MTNPEFIHDWRLYIMAFAVSFAVSLLLTPWAKKISVKIGAVDNPNKERAMHKKPMPRCGGIAIVIGFASSMMMLLFFLEDLRTLQFAGFMVGAAIIVTVGILDDIHDLPAKLKFIVQIIAALVVVFTGTRVEFIGWPFREILEYASVPITILWIVGITNAVNFIDGVDGLAAGVTSIAASFLMVLCIMTGSPLAVVFAATLAGSCLGFLPRNFSPAEVIMGDTGATFLGYVLAVSSIIGVFKGYAVLSVAIIIFAMALPIFNIFFVTISRILKHQPISTPDRGHMHHKLIDAGYSHTKTVVTLYGISVLCGSFAIVIAIQDFRVLAAGLAALAVILSIIYAYRKRMSKHE